MKVKNRLLNFNDKIIYQDDNSFLFSLDSVLLANFVSIRLSDKKIIDLCSGNAPIPMLLSFRTKASIYGVEIQKEIYNMGLESILENGMDKQITFINDDVNNLFNYDYCEKFDVVVCNPPYFKYQKGSLINNNDKKTIARHEVLVKLEDIIMVSKYLLKTGGTFALVHRPSRFMEILFLMKKYNIEPKRVRFVYPKKDKEANMVLIEGVKNGKSDMKVLPPLIVYDEAGNYELYIKKMFGSEDNVAE